MTNKYMQAVELCELLDSLKNHRTNYREALRRRLLTGTIKAYCATAVFSNKEGNLPVPIESIDARVWAHIFAQDGDDLIWPSQDMSTFLHEEGNEPCRSDYLGVYFRYNDLADFLPIAASVQSPLDPANVRPAPDLLSSKSKKGRPRSAFWDRMVVEVARRIYVGDITPPISAAIVRKDLLAWLADQGEAPDRTTVDSFFSELERVLNTEHYKRVAD